MSSRFDPDLQLLFDFFASADGFQTPEKIEAWCRKHDLVEHDAAFSYGDVSRVARFRIALRDFVSEMVGRHRDPMTVPTLQPIADASPFRIVFKSNGQMDSEPTGCGLERALAQLLIALHRSQLRGELAKLKACPGCGQAFLDTTKNGSRIWCETNRCGSRARARAYRIRAKAAKD